MRRRRKLNQKSGAFDKEEKRRRTKRNFYFTKNQKQLRNMVYT